jgi:hypothetical protein
MICADTDDNNNDNNNNNNNNDKNNKNNNNDDTVATLNIGPFVMLTEVGYNYPNYWAILFNKNMRGNVN